MELRRSLVPYLYSLARESSEQGYPICRSNPLEAPGWDRGYRIWDQYFIGDRLYAAPILDETDIPPTILPPGGWYCGLTGHYYHSDGSTEVPKGGDWKQAPPHFFKAGTIMVKQAPGHPVDPLPDTFHVHCFIDAKANSRDTFVLYEDDGETRDFERGSYAETAFRLEVERDSVNVNIQPRHRCRCLPQMPENRSYTITLHEGKNTSSIEVTNLPREASYEVHFKRQQA
jgi:alpha-glucosidase